MVLRFFQPSFSTPQQLLLSFSVCTLPAHILICDLLSTHSSITVLPSYKTTYSICLFVSFHPSKLDSNIIYSIKHSVTFPQDSNPPLSLSSFLPPLNPSPLSTLNHDYNQCRSESILCHLLAWTNLLYLVLFISCPIYNLEVITYNNLFHWLMVQI